jgi:GNAT superfamily N-acetyltransferase
MELPVTKVSHEPSVDVLRRAIGRAAVVLGRTVAEETVLAIGTCLSNPDRPGVRSANFAADLSLPDDADPDEALDQIADHFRRNGAPCHTLRYADTHWPPPLADALSRRGYTPRTRVVLLHRGSTPAPQTRAAVQVIPARAAYGELRGFYDRTARQAFGADDWLAGDLVDTFIDRLDEPRLDLFMARLDGQPAAVAGVLSLGQIGVIDPAYCDTQFRGRGIAAFLMNRLMEHCHRSMFEQVIVDRADGCVAMPFYQSLGFGAVGSYIRYGLDSMPQAGP